MVTGDRHRDYQPDPDENQFHQGVASESQTWQDKKGAADPNVFEDFGNQKQLNEEAKQVLPAVKVSVELSEHHLHLGIVGRFCRNSGNHDLVEDEASRCVDHVHQQNKDGDQQQITRGEDGEEAVEQAFFGSEIGVTPDGI